MDRSAWPYFYYLILLCIGLLYFGFVGYIQRRKFLLFVCAHVTVGIVRYLLVVISAGDGAWIERNDILWLIRSAVYVEATLYGAVVVASAVENIDLPALGQGIVDLLIDIARRAMRSRPDS